jgi:hypothetical protein
MVQRAHMVPAPGHNYLQALWTPVCDLDARDAFCCGASGGCGFLAWFDALARGWGPAVFATLSFHWPAAWGASSAMRGAEVHVLSGFEGARRCGGVLESGAPGNGARPGCWAPSGASHPPQEAARPNGTM